MKLDILVPKYNEDEEQIGYLLNTIECQRGVDLNDIRVIIFNDGGIPLNESILSRFHYCIDYYDGDHRGVSATRNRLLDLSDGEYIMCCDADDMFSDMRGLSYVFKAMKNDFDVFVSSFIEEGITKNENTSFVVRNKDQFFVHGKVFRRQYLIDNNIRWKDEFTYSGDTYFLGLALRTNKKHVYCSTPFYMWKWNSNSICRKSKSHYADEFDMKLRVVESLIDELLARDMMGDARNYALYIMYDGYYVMQTNMWERIDESHKNEIVHKFKEFYKKQKQLIESASKKELFPVIRAAKMNQLIRGNIMESITYDNWLKTYIL